MEKLKTIIFLSLFSLSIVMESTAGVDPYSFYPSSTYKPDEVMFRPARELVDRNPLRPLVVTDKSGNKSYVTSQGEVMVKVDKSGNKTFMIKGRRSHQRESDGDIARKWEYEGGNNVVEVQNESGELIGMEEQGIGGKTVAEYDELGNITKSYKYNKYGKRMEWVVDELTQARVKYGLDGRASHDVDAEGNRIATYNYDDDGRLEYREDIYGNRTHYDKRGNRTTTVAKDGYLMVTYNYRKNSDGYYEVESVKDEITGNITLYKDGKQQ
jgi:hypothetical protein